jgi:hypothetical protein
MNRQEMMQHYEEPGPRERKPRVQFGKAEAWHDCHGTHRRVEIWWGGEVAGEIAGEPYAGATSEYTVKIAGKRVGPDHTKLADAKAYVRANCFKSK